VIETTEHRVEATEGERLQDERSKAVLTSGPIA